MTTETEAMEEAVTRAINPVRAFFEGKWWIAMWLIAAAELLELLK